MTGFTHDIVINKWVGPLRPKTSGWVAGGCGLDGWVEIWVRAEGGPARVQGETVYFVLAIVIRLISPASAYHSNLQSHTI